MNGGSCTSRLLEMTKVALEEALNLPPKIHTPGRPAKARSFSPLTPISGQLPKISQLSSGHFADRWVPEDKQVRDRDQEELHWTTSGRPFQRNAHSAVFHHCQIANSFPLTSCQSSNLKQDGWRSRQVPALEPQLGPSTGPAAQLGHITGQAREHTDDMGKGEGDSAAGGQADHIGKAKQ